MNNIRIFIRTFRTNINIKYNRMKKLNLTLCWLFVAVFALQQLCAQQLQPLPVDPKVKYGKLDNGLTYYIRQNKLPENRADFYIAQQVGSILEEDSQAGLAHFLEHMAFNGTKNFPGKMMTNYLETVGVRFGENLNAYTSFDKTVYMIMNAPVTRQGIIDSCLLVLHDWSNGISLDGEEIDKERGVIREEWRTSGNAGMRLMKQQLPAMYPGSQYANRLPIGSIDVINNFKHDEIRAYYKKWYRPDLQAVIVVGDIDPDKIEAQLKTLFADVPKPVNPAERILYPVPDNEEPLVSVAQDKEATIPYVYLFFKHDQMPDEVKASAAGIVMNYIKNVSSVMMNERFREILQKPDAPFLGASGYDGNYFVAKTKDAWNVFCAAKEGKVTDALAAITRETERVNKYGFTASEYERARVNVLKNYESNYKERDKQKNGTYSNRYVGHFTDGGSISGIENEYAMINQIAPSVTLEQVNQYIQDIIGEKNVVISVSGPEKEGLVYPTKEELLDVFNKARQEELTPYVETVSDEPLIEELPAPGKIVSSKENELLGVTELTLSNGIKVLLKKTDFKDDQVLMTATSPGGTTMFGNEDIANQKLINSAINLGGVGNFSKTDLAKKLAGKKVNVYVSLGPDCEKVDGSSSPQDIETMFQLIYLYFNKPRMDNDAYASFEERMKSQLTNLDLNPMVSFSDTLSTYLYNGNPRVMRVQLSDFDHISYARMMDLYKERYADASDFIFTFVGNVDTDAIKPLIEQYLATLPSLGRKEPKGREDVYANMQKGITEKRFARSMETPKASIVGIYSGQLDFTPENMTLLTALKQILDIVYVEKVREEAGGTYGVSVSSQLGYFPKGEVALQTYFDTDPEKADLMNKIVREELQSIAKDGPRIEDFNKTKENMQKKYAENLKENSYWLRVVDDYYFHNLDRHTPNKAVLDGMTSKQIQEIAQKILSQGNMLEVFMEPAK